MEHLDRVLRITEMEARMEAVQAAATELEQALDAWERVRPDLAALREYYDGGLWRQDYEADEAGLLPPGLKRGVLSQDGLYDLLERAEALPSPEETED